MRYLLDTDFCVDHLRRQDASKLAAKIAVTPNDLMIAAVAQANKLTLVTRNTAEFSRVPGLQLENWE